MCLTNLGRKEHHLKLPEKEQMADSRIFFLRDPHLPGCWRAWKREGVAVSYRISSPPPPPTGDCGIFVVAKSWCLDQSMKFAHKELGFVFNVQISVGFIFAPVQTSKCLFCTLPSFATQRKAVLHSRGVLFPPP